jgi:hypothetical protein
MVSMYTKDTFIGWMRRAPAGARTIYHIGNLLVDRPRSRATDETAAAAWEAMESGKVHLVQRTYDGATNYIAIKRAPPYEPVRWVGCYDRRRKNYNKSVKEAA